jgi:hypothetical protein
MDTPRPIVTPMNAPDQVSVHPPAFSNGLVVDMAFSLWVESMRFSENELALTAEW